MMFFRTTDEIWSDLLFMALLVAGTEATSYLLTVFPIEQNAIIVFSLVLLYILGFKDGQRET
jgi:hypothetical protein